ncbi:MAG: ArnT family glycosyltransferase [Desulfococcaceae bacterium]
MNFSYYPGNLQLLYTIPLYFGNDIVPKLIHWAFGVGTALLVLFHLREKTGRNLALLGAILFLSVPAIVRLAISAYVDLGLVFFSTASLLAFLRWTETGGIDRFFLGSAAFAGLALGTKYNGLILIFVMACFVVLASARRRKGIPRASWRALGLGVLFVGVSLLVFSPWMIRNYVWTSNPFHPLFPSVFSRMQDAPVQEDAISGAGARKAGLLTYRRTLFGESWPEVILLPIRLFFQGEDNNLRLFDGRLNPGLLVLPFFAFLPPLSGRARSHARWLALFSLLFFWYTFFGRELRARYLVPIVPPLAILAMMGLRNLWNRVRAAEPAGMRKAGIALLSVGVGCVLFWNGLYIRDQFVQVRPLSYLSGNVGRDDYIRARRPEHSAMEFINRNLPEDARILFFFMGRRGYHCDRDYLFDSHGGAGSLLLDALGSAAAPESALEILRSRGITHFLIRASIFQRWIAEDLEPELRGRTEAFLRENASVVFFRDGYAVLELDFDKAKGEAG